MPFIEFIAEVDDRTGHRGARPPAGPARRGLRASAVLRRRRSSSARSMTHRVQPAPLAGGRPHLRDRRRSCWSSPPIRRDCPVASGAGGLDEADRCSGRRRRPSGGASMLAVPESGGPDRPRRAARAWPRTPPTHLRSRRSERWRRSARPSSSRSSPRTSPVVGGRRAARAPSGRPAAASSRDGTQSLRTMTAG